MLKAIKDKAGSVVKILLFIAALLLSPLLIFGFSYTVLTKFGYTARYLKRVAFVIDIAGNVICGQLFNDLLRKQDGYKFGYYKDTISYVLGRNHEYKKLTKLGNIIRIILDTIEKDHCKKAFLNKQ